MKNVKNLFDLQGKVSLVTGGGYGLGKIMATGLAEAGSNVVVCSRKLEACEETARELEKAGVESLPLKCDLTNETDVDLAISNTLDRFNRIDILVNNAGRTWGAPPEDFKLKDWQKVIDVNLNGTFLITQRAGREMIRQKSGKIINISSYAGLGGTDPNHLNAIPYNTSKGALIVFTKDLATKWAPHNINVNCIVPGWFPSKMTKWMIDNKGEALSSRMLIKRFGREEDLKGAIVYLASPASDYVTGQTLCVDGGLSAWI